MDHELLKELQPRAEKYLAMSGAKIVEPIAAGGSAAVYIAQRGDKVFAVKVYDPALLQGKNGAAERKRIELQRDLKGHTCRFLVQIHEITLNDDGCFIEMEYVPWDTLKKAVGQVPDAVIPTLLGQLVEAARFLEAAGIVHRDIKPENILVSPDFTQLRLIDLGVVRAASIEEDGADATDHGDRRPFIATAQYSSPEYLFRLEVPSADMWRALTFYQIGGVLHDLLVKRPLFAEAVRTENKHVISMAVFRDKPDLSTAPQEHASLALLATHCLVKDPNLRLRLVSWERFVSPELTGAERLRANSAQMRAAAQARRELDELQRGLTVKRENFVRDAEKALNLALMPLVAGAFTLTSFADGVEAIRLLLRDSQGFTVHFALPFTWSADPLPTRGVVTLLASTDREPDLATFRQAAIGEVDTQANQFDLCAAAVDRIGLLVEIASGLHAMRSSGESAHIDLVAQSPLQ